MKDVSKTSPKRVQGRRFEKSTFKKFGEYYGTKTNVVYHRAKFNKRVQNEGEPIKQFITDLHTLVKPCNFGTLEDEMIRDRIIVGMINQSLSEVLQLDADITLAKVIEKSTMAEEIKTQQSTVRDSQPKSVDAISRPQRPRGRQDKDYKKQRVNRPACRK